MYVFLVLFGIVGAGAVDQQAARFQGVPDVMDDTALASGTEFDVGHAPLACTVGVFAEHTLARAGHVGDDHVEQMRKTADLLRIVIGDNAVRVSPFGDVFSQDVTPAADHFVADKQASFRQQAEQVCRFSTRSGTQVEAPDRRFYIIPYRLFEEHGGGFLHVVGSGVEQRVECERQPFR